MCKINLVGEKWTDSSQTQRADIDRDGNIYYVTTYNTLNYSTAKYDTYYNGFMLRLWS